MCHIYSSTPERLYRRERRSLRIHGHVTTGVSPFFQKVPFNLLTLKGKT